VVDVFICVCGIVIYRKWTYVLLQKIFGIVIAPYGHYVNSYKTYKNYVFSDRQSLVVGGFVVSLSIIYIPGTAYPRVDIPCVKPTKFSTTYTNPYSIICQSVSQKISVNGR
jgi:hypothetical protein